MTTPGRTGTVAGLFLLALLVLPVAGLVGSTSPGDIWAAASSAGFRESLALSIRTSTAAMVAIALLGTPLAWLLSRRQGRVRRLGLTLVELPVVLPPAVLGVALLQTFGRAGTLGPALESVGVGLPFTEGAVVLAQILVGAPLHVLAAAAAFDAVDDDLLLVARTLGASPRRAWWTVALPAAAPGLASGAAMAWSRALGEFGATLMFAGNLPGTTQTLPLAIYSAMERDMTEARAVSVLLLGVAVSVLLGARALGGVSRAR